MKTLSISLFSSLFIVILFGTSVLADTKSEYDRGYNFYNLGNWDFKDHNRMPRDPVGKNDIWDSRIRQGITRGLSSEGFAQTSGSPTFFVSYHMTTRERYEPDYFYYGWRPYYHYGWLGGWWDPGWYGPAYPWGDVYNESTLVMDIIDAKTNKMVWRGYDTHTINFNKADKTIAKSVDHLIKRLVHDIHEARKNERG